MQCITATYRIVTPMFLGGADQQAESIRPPSVKGALRFWWRAIAWGRFYREADGETCNALRALHTAEARLFGLAAKEGAAHSGQGAFLLSILPSFQRPITHLSKEQMNKKYVPSDGHKYLLGQGIYRHNSGYDRDAIVSGEFDLTLLIKPAHQQAKASLDDLADLVRAVSLFGLLGGLGSRSRHGFGSLSIQKLSGELFGTDLAPLPQKYGELQPWFGKLLLRQANAEPPFSAFWVSPYKQIYLSEQGNNAWQLLGQMGEYQRVFRSRKNGQAINEKQHTLCKSDYTTVVDALSNRKMSAMPNRATYGLPHNYFFKSLGRKVEISPKKPKMDRRSSPLLMHLHQFPDGSCCSIYSFFCSKFLPDGVGVQVRPQGATTQNGVVATPNWDIVKTYLESLPRIEGVV